MGRERSRMVSTAISFNKAVQAVISKEGNKDFQKFIEVYTRG